MTKFLLAVSLFSFAASNTHGGKMKTNRENNREYNEEFIQEERANCVDPNVWTNCGCVFGTSPACRAE